MYNRHNIKKFLKLIFSACFILVLSACSSDDDTVATTETVTEVPQFIQKLALTTDGSLVAWITIDKGTAEEKKIEMTIAAGTASSSIPDLSRTTHTVLIEFELTVVGFEPITLAAVTGTVDLSSGDGSLTFADGDYTTNFDEDNDTFTNLIEVTNDSDPFDELDLPSISDCILDTSVIGGCILG